MPVLANRIMDRSTILAIMNLWKKELTLILSKKQALPRKKIISEVRYILQNIRVPMGSKIPLIKFLLNTRKVQGRNLAKIRTSTLVQTKLHITPLTPLRHAMVPQTSARRPRTIGLMIRYRTSRKQIVNVARPTRNGALV